MRYRAPDEISPYDDSGVPRPDETEFDSLEEVDAVVRTLRRTGIQYSLAIVALLIAMPLLALLAPWWYARPVWGGLTLNFIALALLLNLAFVAAAEAFNRVANRSEDEMLGRLDDTAKRDDV
ncbi:MAG: hypothetical protein ACRDK3_11805 [Actinomycetota bacterium]